MPWSEIPEDMEAKCFNLTGSWANKQIIEIHQEYKIQKSDQDQEVELIPKTWSIAYSIQNKYY